METVIPTCIILEQVNTIQYLAYLGITNDSKLKWNFHIINLMNSVRNFFLGIS